MKYHLGFDIGSTTVKLVALDEQLNMVYGTYQRHLSDVRNTVRQVLEDCHQRFEKDTVTIHVTGSGGLSVYEYLDIPFVQEVIAGTEAISRFIPQTDVAIELGGEDSKITYLKGSLEQRMNSICAGGTGAFIDQMAHLLQTDAAGLNELAQSHNKIYPIASRCGVFAKTDIQALINQGASKNDIAASVFQSVVNQTISNLACGRPIRGKVAFLGGPLHFLSGLKERFIASLNLSPEQVILPDHSQLFVALGAAVSSINSPGIAFSELIERARRPVSQTNQHAQRIDRLFDNQAEIEAFKTRHAAQDIPRGDITTYQGPMYLGIDAGSTTLKLVVLSDDHKILYSHYGSNKGKPLEIVSQQLIQIYNLKHDKAWLACSGVTGYGEDLIKAALQLDFGEVETIAHYRAARHFEPEVDFILDIGGQDMKSMQIKDGVIESILLNEACSSGCGSFLETFAESLNLTVAQFAELALTAEHPIDLGSRCTVFMNSNVKQAQKEGAEVADIAAGLAHSVIKNALQKVIMIRDPKKLGRHIVVQGGTFYSDAVLRAFEMATGRQVIRPGIAGLMGAFGIALLAQERAEERSSIIGPEDITDFSYHTKQTHCRHCSNNCRLLVHHFSSGARYISGNRCERGSGLKATEDDLPNLYKYKYQRVFDYRSLEPEQAFMGTVGLPRVLNMYENYPFWHTFFTALGYRVVLSDDSTRQIYEQGMETIISETACYPAKISHGHIENLIEKGVDFIFYPSVFYEEKQFARTDNHLNCPVVAGYSEVIKNNVDGLKDNRIRFLNPFISFDDREKLELRLARVLKSIDIQRVAAAVREAFEEQDRYRADVRRAGRRALAEMERRGLKGIVLAGRPYHIDPEINHGIAELITSLGAAVISEDAIAHKVSLPGRLRVLDQWNYHSRLYRAAKFVGTRDDLELVQLNSFGCGLDAVTTDQAKEILHHYNKLHTVIKIDEINNLGAIKIRLRSLLEAVDKRRFTPNKAEFDTQPVLYDKSMAGRHTLLLPQMAPIHFEILAAGLRTEGFNVEVLENTSPKVVNHGLNYVNNDACYPSLFVVGQFIDALKSGRYDVDQVTLVMAQTGGACRASNYVAFIRKAIAEAGFGHVPVLGLSFQGLESHPGFKLSPAKGKRLLEKSIKAILLGDLIMRLANATRPYELTAGSTDKLVEYWIKQASDYDLSKRKKSFRRLVRAMVDSFNRLEINYQPKPRVGIVGEILVKYLPAANNNVQDLLEQKGAEVVVPDLMDFVMYFFKNAQIKRQKLSQGLKEDIIGQLGIAYIDSYRNLIRQALSGTRFGAPRPVDELAEMAEPFVDLGNQYGEGWLLTAEMVELIADDAPNIVCVQPFGCLPNHITGKGVIKAIREKYPLANIVPIDYDASASAVNQFNRIKLMLAQAKKNLARQPRRAPHTAAQPALVPEEIKI